MTDYLPGDNLITNLQLLTTDIMANMWTSLGMVTG
jgi:hypothetical protein